MTHDLCTICDGRHTTHTSIQKGADRAERQGNRLTTMDALDASNDLHFIANRWPDLRARLRPAGGTSDGAARPKPGSRPPIDLAISDLMFEIEEEARSLGHVLMDETDWEPRTSTMPGLLADVASRYGHFTSGDERTALAFSDWAHDYRQRVTKALERPVPPRYIGDCPVGRCEGDLYVKEGRSSTVCQVCGTETDLATQREFVQAKFEERLMTRNEIVAALKWLEVPVPIATVHKWVQRGRLTEVIDGLFRLADALELAKMGTRRVEVRA